GATIMAMIHALENVRKHPENHLFMPALQQQLDLASLAAKHVVNSLVLSRPKDLPVLEETISRLKTTTTDLEKLYDRQHLDFTVQLDLHRFISLLQSAIQYLEDGLLLLTRINQKKKLSTATLTIKRKHKLLPSWGALFRFQNVPLKHTLRLMLVTSVGIAIYQGFEIPRGYWISLTIMVVLQPDFGTTQQKSLQRVIGTFLGGVLGTLLLIHPLPSVVFILAVTIFSILFIYYQQRNYIISVTFLTMMLVAMFEVAGPIDWHIAAFRLLATVLGVILSVAAAFVLWPDWERTKVRLVMARGLRANFNLTHQIHHELLSQTGFHARIIAMRRKAESANISITESVKIVQLEPGTKKQKQKAAQNIAFYNARLTRELTSLAALLPQLKAANQTLEETDAFLMQAMSQLEETITALVSEKNTKEIISQNITFSTSALKTQLPATPAATVHNPALHIDTEVLQVEVVHEQLNKIADAIYHISKSVHFLNQY
ncbi:MAG: hypothetical protein JWQ14_1465, partial [Adhaeribacter sp.]|nr:hypothetical protein [Adhaeribacter sp.]